MHDYVVVSILLLVDMALLVVALLLVYALLRIGMQLAAQFVTFNTTMDSVAKLLLRTAGDAAPVMAQPEEETPDEILLRNGWVKNPYAGMWSHEKIHGCFFVTEEALRQNLQV